MADGYYKCDRCGTFERGPITRANRGLSQTDFSGEKHRRMSYGHRTGEDNTGSVTRTIDLCEDCRKAFTEWLDDD